MPIERTIFVTNNTVHAVIGQVLLCPHESAADVFFDSGEFQTVVFEKDVKARAFVNQINRINRGDRRIVDIAFHG